MDHKDAKTDRPAIEEILRYCQRATKEGLMGAIGPQTTVDICEYALSLETENASLRKEWQGFTESIAPLIECEPHDIQGAGYILNAVAAMQEEERNYSGIGDELREAESENARLIEVAKEAYSLIYKLLPTDCQDWDLIKTCADMQRAIEQEIHQPHPGDGLLKELEQLRKTGKSMVELLNQLIKDGGQYKRALELACNHKLNDCCPRDEMGWTPSECVGENCGGSECVGCWGDYFLAQAKAGERSE